MQPRLYPLNSYSKLLLLIKMFHCLEGTPDLALDQRTIYSDVLAVLNREIKQCQSGGLLDVSYLVI